MSFGILWSFGLSNIDFWGFGCVSRYYWYITIFLYNWSYFSRFLFRSINLWTWGWLRQYRKINIILCHWSYFRKSNRHIRIYLCKLRNFRYSFQFICRKRCRLWCNHRRIWLYLYILFIRISLNSAFDCFKELIITFKWWWLAIL